MFCKAQSNTVAHYGLDDGLRIPAGEKRFSLQHVHPHLGPPATNYTVRAGRYSQGGKEVEA